MQRRPALDALAQTHETLLQLVTHLSDTAARLDAKLTQLEERVLRVDPTGNTTISNSNSNSVLLRRRSSQRDSAESGSSLVRRPSARTTTTVSESTLETGRHELGGLAYASRVLRADELAAIHAAAAIVSEGRGSSFAEAGDTLVSLPSVVSKLDDDSARDGAQAAPVLVHHALTRPPQVVRTAVTASRSRSLGSATRQRLTSFQQALVGGSAVAEASMRRPSLSALWSRRTTTASATSPATVPAATMTWDPTASTPATLPVAGATTPDT